MEASAEYPKVVHGSGYAVGHLDDLSDGPGFRKVRNTAPGDALCLCAGGKEGYVGRDRRLPEGEQPGPHHAGEPAA